MHVSVVIVGFRNTGDIQRCLAALERSTHADFEVVICENGGGAAYAALTAALPAQLAGGRPVAILRAETNLGYAGGVNRCLAASPHADAWWVLNPDTEAGPDTMARMVARLQVGDCEAVGCTVYLPGGQVQSYGGHWQGWLGRAVSIGRGEPIGHPDPATIELRQNYLNGASMMISRRFLEVTGPMREDYFLYCEEVEWCLRARARGLRLGFAPDAPVLHHYGTTMGDQRDYRRGRPLPEYLGERNRLLLTRDCFPLRQHVVILSGLVILLYRYTRRRAWRSCGYGLRGLWAGVMGERGAPAWVKQ
jgi:hypothetical protein